MKNNKDATEHQLGSSTYGSDRRADTPTRDAIEALQDLLFDPDASSRIFQIVLTRLVELTDSHYGVCYVSGTHAEFPIYPDAELTPIYFEDTPNFIRTDVLASWVGQKSLLTMPVFYNDPIAPGTRSVLSANVAISSVMILPIILHSELRAIIVLGSNDRPYSGALLNKLKPFIGAVMCTLQTAETVRGSFLGIDKKIANNRYLSNLISSSPIGVIVVNSDASILLSNPAAEQMFYYGKSSPENDEAQVHTAKSLAGISIKTFIPDYESLFNWSRQEVRYGSEHEALGPVVWKEQEAFREDGSPCVVNLTIFRFTHGNQRLTTLQIQDITSVRQRADDYKRTLQQLNALTQLAPVAIIRVDNEWNCVFANDKWFEFSGLIEEENLGPNWINAVHANEISTFLEALHFSLRKGKDYRQELRLVTPLGATKWVDFNMRVLFSAEGEVEGFLGTCADVTDRYINEEKLRHIAEYDGLTGLANRVLFQDRLQQAFLDSQRDNALITVFFLDLDGFKDVNDTLGHNIGDVLLQKVAERLLNTLRKNDTVARFGGDEFVVLLGHDNHATDADVVAMKVIESVAEPYLIEGNELYITTSLGIAQGNYTDASPDSLLKHADLALYNAKHEGKNTYQLFDEDLEAGSKQRISLLGLLRTGLKRNKFQLYYQPICLSTSSRLVGFEALLRFKDNKGHIVGPDKFIPLLEETGMIIDVGRWVINETCKQLKIWQSNELFPKDGYLTFNVSAKQLLDDSFVPHIRESCLLHKIDPRHLVMEMTESVIINKPEKVKDILKELKRFGLRLALDDFGTGYSSLSYLQNYPFDIIKIEKSFIDDLSDQSNNKKIVKAIIALAASLELQVVAEGVESEKIKNIISALGADWFQGFLISKPIPCDKVLTLLNTRQHA